MRKYCTVFLEGDEQITVSPNAIEIHSLKIFPEGNYDKLTEIRDAIDDFIDNARITDLNEVDSLPDPALLPDTYEEM